MNLTDPLSEIMSHRWGITVVARPHPPLATLSIHHGLVVPKDATDAVRRVLRDLPVALMIHTLLVPQAMLELQDPLKVLHATTLLVAGVTLSNRVVVTGGLELSAV